jgi:hypothetical protein
MSKKVLTISLTVVVVLLTAGLIYYFFFSNEGVSNPNIETNDISNPFGEFLPNENIDETQEDLFFDDNNTEVDVPRLRKITSVPVAGSQVFEREVEIVKENASTTERFYATSTENFFRYIERATGHLYETGENTLINERLTNTTIPKIYEAIFSDNLNDFIYRYVDENNSNLIKTFFASLEERGEDVEEDVNVKYRMEGFLLNDAIEEIFIDNETVLSFYSIPNGSIFELSNINTPDEATFSFYSQISQLNNQFINDNYIGMTTKPSFDSEGYSYIIDSEGQIEKTLGPLRGLTTNYSPDGLKVIFSKVINESLVSGIYSLEDGRQYAIGFNTLPEKCAWGPDSDIIYCGVPSSLSGNFPDDWYMGIESFSDSLVSYDLNTSENEILIFNGVDSPEFIDIIDMKVSPSEEFLLFQNKKDLSLWSYDLR